MEDTLFIKGIDFVHVKKEHEDGIIELLLTGFREKSKKQLKEQFRYLNYLNYIQNYEPLGIIAIDKKRIVGYRGFIGVPFLIGNRKIKILMLISGVIHPDYRRKGIFLKLHEKAYEIFYDQYNFFLNTSSNNYSGPSYLKQNWNILGEKDYFVKKQYWVNYNDNNNVIFNEVVPSKEISNIYKDSIFFKNSSIRVDLSSIEFIEWFFGQNGYKYVIYKKDERPTAYCCYTINGKRCDLIHFDMICNDNSFDSIIEGIAKRYLIKSFYCFTKKGESLRNNILKKAGFWSTNISLIRRILKIELTPIIIRSTGKNNSITDFTIDGIDVGNINNWDITRLSYF